MEKQNVTLSLPVALLQKLRVTAAKRNTSMSNLLENAAYKALAGEDNRELRTKRMIARMKNSPARDFGDKIPWTREEINERIR